MYVCVMVFKWHSKQVYTRVQAAVTQQTSVASGGTFQFTYVPPSQPGKHKLDYSLNTTPTRMYISHVGIGSLLWDCIVVYV